MKIQHTWSILAASLSVAAVAGGGILLNERDHPAATHELAAAAQNTVGSIEVPSLLADAACTLNALPTLPTDLDQRVADAVADTRFAQAIDPAVADDKATAIERVTSLSDDAQAVTAIAAAKVPFSIGGPILGDPSHPLVAPGRCVWVVTAVGPITPEGSLSGSTPETAQTYTALLDAASGELIDLMSGPSAPSLITGLGVLGQ